MTPRPSASVTNLAVEQVPIDSLYPDPANPRRIGDDELITGQVFHSPFDRPDARFR